MSAMLYIIGCTLLQIMRYATDAPDWVYVIYNIVLGLSFLLETFGPAFMKGDNK